MGSDTLLCHELGLDHIIYGDAPKPVIVTKGFDYVDRKDKHYLEKMNYIRKYFLYPKKKSEEVFRDQIISDHLGFSSEVTNKILRKIFIRDFLVLSPFFFRQYIKFVIKLFKKLIIKD